MMRVCSGGRETLEETMVYTPLSSNKNRCVFFFFDVSAAAAALESMIWAVPIFLIDFLTLLYLVCRFRHQMNAQTLL